MEERLRQQSVDDFHRFTAGCSGDVALWCASREVFIDRCIAGDQGSKDQRPGIRKAVARHAFPSSLREGVPLGCIGSGS